MTTGSFVRVLADNTAGNQKQWSGGNDPGRHKANNAYDACIQNFWSQPTVTKYGGSQSAPGGRATSANWQYTASPGPDALVVNELLSQISERIRGHEFNAAIFAAESKESLTTVVNTMRQVFTAFNCITRKDLAGALRSLSRVSGHSKKKASQRLEAGDVPGAWLSLTYGWVPLLNDIHAAMKAYEERSNGARGVTVRVHKNKQLPPANLYSASDNTHFRSMSYRRSSVRYVVTFLENLSAVRTLGLNNPAAVLWEKLPWSFVVDWALPIGTYLDNLGVFSGLQLSYVRTYYYKHEEMIQQTSRVGATWLGEEDLTFPTRGYLSRTWVQRTIGTSLNVPFPSLKSMERTFSIGHIQNASALIGQMLVNARRNADRVDYRSGTDRLPILTAMKS